MSANRKNDKPVNETVLSIQEAEGTPLPLAGRFSDQHITESRTEVPNTLQNIASSFDNFSHDTTRLLQYLEQLKDDMEDVRRLQPVKPRSTTDSGLWESIFGKEMAVVKL